MNTAFLERIERALNEKGFSRELTFEAFPNMVNWKTQSQFSLYRNTDAQVNKDVKWNVTYINGYDLYISTVYRHNGTEENVNVDIKVSKFENGLGRNLEVPEGFKQRVRINQNCSDKVFNKRIQTIVEAYEAIIAYNK